MFKIKKYLLNKWYNFIFWLEDFFGWFETQANNHRKWLDDKYYDKYLS